MKNPFRRITLKEDIERRIEAAQQRAEHHRILAAEADDTVTWAKASASGHREMAAMYEARIKKISTEAP